MISETKWDGQKIGKAGLLDGIDMDSYHGDLCEAPSVSSGGLRTIWDPSPADYFDESYLNPSREEPDERKHFSMGRAAHHLLFLGKEGFDAEYVIQPEKYVDDEGKVKPWSNNATICKDWHKERRAKRLTCITKVELDHISGMSRSLARTPLVKAGILDGLVERSLVWKDSETGVWLKSRPDVIPTDSWDVADLKTSPSVTDDSLQRSITSFGYAQQAALCQEGLEAVLGVEMKSFSLVYAQKKRPYSIEIVTIPEADIALGRQQNRWAIRKFAECLSTGIWPGPGGTAQDARPMGIAPYARARIEARLGLAAQEQAMSDYRAEWEAEHAGEDE